MFLHRLSSFGPMVYPNINFFCMSFDVPMGWRCHACNIPFMLFNKLSVGKNCQTHGSYVIFPVESTGVISFLVTRIFQQTV